MSDTIPRNRIPVSQVPARAFDKARAVALPVIRTGELTYRVPSASRGSHFHHVKLDSADFTLEIGCSCEAKEHCWAMAAVLIEHARLTEESELHVVRRKLTLIASLTRVEPLDHATMDAIGRAAHEAASALHSYLRYERPVLREVAA